jgi:hypothetical protein
MNNKGFAETHVDIETPNDVDVAEKPLKTSKKRVDINILKSKLEETEAKELKKNIFILSLLIICVGAFGIYLSF